MLRSLLCGLVTEGNARHHDRAGLDQGHRRPFEYGCAGCPVHRRRAKALGLGIPIRGGVVALQRDQRVQEAARDLSALGVGTVGGDRARAFGRAGGGAEPTIGDLCGHCAYQKCAIGPSGAVWPCVLGRFLNLGNVLEKPLPEIWGGARMAEVLADITSVHGDGAQSCTPPQFLPMCGPCSPCVPSVGHCDPTEADAGAGPDTIDTPA
jgi:radical SAM protein with 4Fe4S-binding SPASM domain